MLNIVPFGNINALRKSGVGVMNSAKFNQYFKGTGINSTKQGGALIRHYNYIERDVVNFKNFDNINRYISPPAMTFMNETLEK